MSRLYFGYYPATILSYDQNTRTARISVEPFTKNAPQGLKARLAYAVGENDRKTEIKIVAGDEVWIFFERGKPHAPIIAFYRGHGEGARLNVRSIEQENIELLANSNFSIAAENINITGEGNWYGKLTIHGSLVAEKITTAGGTDLDTHDHGGVRRGIDHTDPAVL